MTTKTCPGCSCCFSKRDNEKPSKFKRRKYCTQKCYQTHTSYSRNIKDYTGVIFNNLEFIEPASKDTLSGGVLWIVKCYSVYSKGNNTEEEFLLFSLLTRI